MIVHEDRDYNPFEPGSMNEVLDQPLVTAEGALMTALREEDESLEVAEPIVNNACDLAGVVETLQQFEFAATVTRFAFLPISLAVKRPAWNVADR